MIILCIKRHLFFSVTSIYINIFFRLTVVQEYFTYWVDCNPVDLVRTGGVRPQPTTTTTTAAPITTTTNPTTTTIAKRLITAQADAVRSANRDCQC